MFDVKLQDGDVLLDSAGRMVELSAREAAFQRARVRLCARRGQFIYDRELGADWETAAGEPRLPRLTQSLSEALAVYAHTDARALAETENGLTAQIDADGDTITEEVRHYGEL